MKLQCAIKGRGFSLVEVILVGTILAAVAGVLIPAYHLYKIRSDLHIAAEQAEQALHRAQLLSQTGYENTVWGYHPDEGILFAGGSFAGRDQTFDEHFPVPANIAVSGIAEVTYSRLYGVPNIEGDIVFTATNGDQRIIRVRRDTVLSGPPIPPTRFRVHFDRIKNNGNGSAENKVFVGQDAVLYLEDAWVPVTDDGLMIIDDGIDLNVPGISVQRQDGFVRIIAYAGLDENGGKEVIDTTIIFDRGIIDHIENEAGENEGEQPFDGTENDGVGGDEYTLAEDQRSVQFNTRSTNAGDTILIFWQ